MARFAAPIPCRPPYPHAAVRHGSTSSPLPCYKLSVADIMSYRCPYVGWQSILSRLQASRLPKHGFIRQSLSFRSTGPHASLMQSCSYRSCVNRPDLERVCMDTVLRHARAPLPRWNQEAPDHVYSITRILSGSSVGCRGPACMLNRNASSTSPRFLHSNFPVNLTGSNPRSSRLRLRLRHTASVPCTTAVPPPLLPPGPLRLSPPRPLYLTSVPRPHLPLSRNASRKGVPLATTKNSGTPATTWSSWAST